MLKHQNKDFDVSHTKALMILKPTDYDILRDNCSEHQCHLHK
jgi:hypothetical protein